MRRIILKVVILALAILFGFRVYVRISGLRKSPGKGPSRSTVAVEIMPVERRDISNVEELTGSLLPMSRFDVAPKISGRLEKMLVEMGDTVQNGQLIATLDNQEHLQDVEEARAGLEVAMASLSESQSALDVAHKEYERIKVLREKKIASESELDKSEASYKASEARNRVAMAQVEQRKAALRAAEIRLSFTQVRASWEDGSGRRVVGEKYVDEGEMLSAGRPIVSVIDISTMKAELYVPEEDYSRVRVGQPVLLTTDVMQGREFTGKIVRLSPALKETSRAAAIEVLIPNPGYLLKPGAFARAKIETEQHKNAVTVPYAALTKRENRQGVFLLDEKEMKVSFVPVRTGISTPEIVEILEPAIEGRVVTLGQHLLNEGSFVTIPDKLAGSDVDDPDKQGKE